MLASSSASESRSTWWQRRDEDGRFQVAYFSCEFGLDESLPIYSGGLGVLSGDHLKSASDLGVPLVAVGLFYRNGYFRQQLDGERLAERALPAERSGATAARRRAGERRRRAPGRGRHAPTTCASASGASHVGRIALYLLDTDVEGNPDWARRSRTRCTAATGSTGSARRSCSASAAFARCARSASSRPSST